MNNKHEQLLNFILKRVQDGKVDEAKKLIQAAGGQVSGGSAGEYQADEQAGVAGHLHSGFDHPLQLHDMFSLSLDYQLIPKEKTVFSPVFLWQVVPSLPSYAVSACINNPMTAPPVMEAGLSSLKSTGADENRHAKC